MATLRDRWMAFRRADNLAEQAQRIDRLESSLTLALNALPELPRATGEDLLEQLREYDADYVDFLVDQLGWETIGGFGGGDLSNERKLAVTGSRQAWRTSPLAQWAVWTWTSWGLGDGVTLTAEDEAAQETLDEFVQADRNSAVLGQDNIHTLSERVLINGNAFLVFYASTMDGLCTVRAIPQDEMEIITNPDDALVPWFYRRQFTTGDYGRELYYPDWSLQFVGDTTVDEAWERLLDERVVSDRSERADQQTNGQLKRPVTDVCVLHVAHNRKDFDDLWGWPMLTVAIPWLRTHKRYAQARFSVALSVAQFVRRTKVAGGSRAVASVIDTIASNLSQSQYTDTNPPSAPGSTWVENKALDTSELPLTTGAGDAKNDNDMFSWIAGLGAGMTTTTIGLDTARYATAVQMDKVQSFLFTRYKTFWSEQFTRMSRIVLSFAEKYGQLRAQNMDVQVSIDSFSLPDFPDIVASQSQLMTELTSAVNAGVIPSKAVAAIDARMIETALQALGVSDADILTGDEAFEIGEFEPEEEPVAPVIPATTEEPTEAPTEEEPETEPPIEVPPMAESHVGTTVQNTCPLCGYFQATYYESHGGLVVCDGCHKTYDPSLE